MRVCCTRPPEMLRGYNIILAVCGVRMYKMCVTYIHVIICRYYAMDQFSPAPLVNNRAKQTARATTVYRVAIILL